MTCSVQQARNNAILRPVKVTSCRGRADLRPKEDLVLEEGKLPGTTKKESGHGMGLANVQDVLRKYGAEYTVSCRDRWFRFTCAIPCAVHDMSTDNL